MTIKELVKDAHSNAKEHGFWKEPIEFGTAIALVHSELSEALEEIRANRPPIWFKGEKPEGTLIELADAVIRIADLCGWYGFDLEEAIKIKMEYNKTRPYKHGKAF